MANIQEFLSKILSSRFGKDVRDSIHGSIDAINQEVTSYTDAEKTRVREENLRKSNESSRQSSENNRNATEQIRLNNERTRAEKETERLRDENTRKSNESLRVSKEEQRVQTETRRQTEETTRVRQENERIASEENRVQAENRRNQKEQERQQTEDRRTSLENERKRAENSRISSENNRVIAERNREQRIISMQNTFDEKVELINRALSSTSSVTDKTLKLENIAADAKAVGDRLKKIDRDTTTLETNITSKIETVKTALISDRGLTQSGKFADAKAVGDAIRNLNSKVTALEHLQGKVRTLEQKQQVKKINQPIKISLDSEWVAPSDGFIITFVKPIEDTRVDAIFSISNNEVEDIDSHDQPDERNLSIFIKMTEGFASTQMCPVRKGVKYSSIYKHHIESETIVFYPFE